MAFMANFLAKGTAFFLSRKAKQEFSSLGDDVNSMSNSMGEGTRWLFNIMKGKMQRSLPELLQMFGLPQGLFPKNATHYEFDETTGVLTVYMPSICEVGFKDSTILRYAGTVSGVLTQGKLTEIEGMKTKTFVWVKVTSLTVDPEAKKLTFAAGIKKSKPVDAYEALRDGIEVDQF